MTVNQSLMAAAAQAFGATPIRDLRPGGQKSVQLVAVGGRTLVMKVIAVEAGLPDALRRAQREVELLQKVDSPHVVKVASDLVEIQSDRHGATWLEEYLDGQDLGDLMSTPWDCDEVLAMAWDVSTGLAAIHAASVVHRDLSANNIRRLSSGRFVVMDPGFARHTLRSDLTVGGQPGTAGYLSPEHLQGPTGAPTAASDVFGVGILMFRALTGVLPIPYTGDAADYMSRVARVELLDLGSLRPDVPSNVAALVRRCLHPQPARRARNGSRLAEDLEAVR